MKKTRRLASILLAVALVLSFSVLPASAASNTDTQFQSQTPTQPDERSIKPVFLNLPADGEFYKITEDFEMPANDRVEFKGTWSPSYARIEFRLYCHRTGNGATVIVSSDYGGGLNTTSASVYSLYARSVDGVAIQGHMNLSA